HRTAARPLRASARPYNRYAAKAVTRGERLQRRGQGRPAGGRPARPLFATPGIPADRPPQRDYTVVIRGGGTAVLVAPTATLTAWGVRSSSTRPMSPPRSFRRG